MPLYILAKLSDTFLVVKLGHLREDILATQNFVSR